MKTIRFKHIFALTIISLTIVSACKRGEEDPGLTFKSREGRLVGTWELSDMAMETTVRREYSRSNDINSNALDSTVDIEMEQTFSGGTLTSNYDIKALIQIRAITGTDFNVGGSDGATGSWRSDMKYSIPEIKITFNDDYTFGISYAFKSESNIFCYWGKESLSGDWVNTTECAETNDIDRQEFTYVEPIVGTWRWVNEGEVEKVQLAFDPLKRNMGDNIPEAGFPMDYVMSGGLSSPIGLVFDGEMLRLSDKEIKFVNEPYTDNSGGTTISRGLTFQTDDLDPNEDRIGVQTVTTKVERSGSSSATWTKVEE